MSERAVHLRSDEGARLRVVGMDMIVKATGTDTAGAYELVVVEAPRGAAVPPHRHPWAESYLVVEGELALDIGGQHQVAGAGDFLTVPESEIHALEALSDRVNFLHFSTGDRTSNLFTDLAAELPEPPGPGQVTSIAEIGARHDLEFVHR